MSEEEPTENSEETKDIDESEETENVEENFEEEVVKKLMEGVKLIIRDQEITEDSEIIKADLVEIRKDFEPELPAETFGSLDEEISKRMDQAVEAIYKLIDESREEFKESLKNQLLTFRKHVEEMGRSIARAFAEKLKLKYTERVLRKLYEDVVQRELRSRQELLITEVLDAIKPFYASLQSNLEDIKKILLDIKGLYHEWMKAYTYVVREVMDESKMDYDSLIKEINKYKSQYEELQSRFQELNMELAMKEKELIELKEELEKLKNKYSKVPSEEIEKLKETIKSQEELIKEIRSKHQELLEFSNKILSKLIGETISESDITTENIKEMGDKVLGKIKEKDEKIHRLQEELSSKEEELYKLRGLLEELKEQEKLREEYYNLKMNYAKIRGEYEALKEAHERLKEENDALKKRIDELTEQVKSKITRETIESELEKTLREKEEEIEKLRSRIIDLEKNLAEFEKLKVMLEAKDKEIEGLKNKLKEFEEVEKTLTSLRKELEEYKELFGLSVGPPGEAVEAKYSELFEQVKNDLELMRKEIFEKAKQIADVVSENKALRSQLEIKEKEINEIKNENERILKELEEIKTKLKQATLERDEYEKKVIELSRKVEELKRLPEEFKMVLETTTIGKIYLILRDLKKVDIDKLASAIGMPKIQLQRELIKLAKLGLIKVENNTVVYVTE